MSIWKRRTIGIFTLGGSATGVAVIMTEMLNGDIGVAGFIFLVIFLVVYAFGIAAGVLIIENDPRMNSIAQPFWWIQIPIISSPLISYSLFSGARFSVMLTSEIDVTLSGAVGSRFTFFLLNGASFAIGVNVVAILVCYALAKNHRESL